MIPAVILTGVPGAGKTFMAEAFAEAMGAEVVFYQCTEATNASTLIGDINPAEVVRGNPAGAIAPGAMVKLCQAEKPCVLVLDEWDKGDASLDAFLLDFLQSRRVRDMNGDMQYAPSCQVWVFLTSNEERNISDALRRRVRQWAVPRMSGETVAGILGISFQHPLIQVWEGVPNLALSQLQSYINDVGTNDIIDTEVLGQYIELPESFSVVAKDKTTTVTVEVRAASVDIDMLANSPCRKVKYVYGETLRMTFNLHSVVDWLSFAATLKTIITDDDSLAHSEFTAKIQGGDGEDDMGFIIPVAALRSICEKVVVHSDHVAVITRGNRKILIGELRGGDYVLFQEDIGDFLGIIQCSNQ